MKNKTKKLNLLAFNLLTFMFLLVLSLNLAYAQEVNWCCEKTLSGAYCQNAPKDQCDSGFLSSPTSCEATSFCKKGCCYDSDEGICAENVPEEACKANNGVWSDSASCEIPQCELGCCILGQEAAYTSLQRCKKLSGNFGLQMDFRRDIIDEVSCIELATAQDVGACVYEKEFTVTCKFGTRGECDSQKLQGVTNESINFYKDYLCTSQELNTNCEKTQKTSCVEGKDKVYFLDSCGNPANIYDSSKVNDPNYWEKVVKPEKSCQGNSKTCGNCDYLGGSICAKASGGNRPAYGDYICKDINCYDTSNDKDYKNGESWCVFDQGNKNVDTVGSRYFRHICFAGEEIIEPCSDFRQEVCVENSIGEEEDFSQAGCVPNRYQDCVLQKDSDDCLNSDKRDCKWISLDLNSKENIGKNIKSGLLSRVSGKIGVTNLGKLEKKEKEFGRCVPKIAPGLQFWDQSSVSACSIGSQSCIVKFEKKVIGGKKCVENCECLEEGTKVLANSICSAIGDCGADFNYVGKFVNKGYEITVSKGKDGKEKEIPKEIREAAPPGGPAQFDGPPSGQELFPGANQPAPTSGNVIQGFIVKTYNNMQRIK